VAQVPPILAQLWRGEVVEAEFRGVLAVADSAGGLIGSAGDPGRVTYMRSSSKPFQAISVVVSGATERFELTAREIAVMAASHGGEPIHVEAVRSILAKIGLTEDALQCGVHPPAHKAAAEELVRRGEKPRAVHNNCAGKHAGMLALARHIGAPIDGYLSPEHPVQRRALQVISEMSDVPAAEVQLGVDGCGVPTFALPVRNIALMFARLAQPQAAPEHLREAARVVAQAMMANPEMIAETSGRWDTELMRAMPGGVVSKAGAEGLACCGIVERGIGIALKSTDGGGRANAAVTYAVLQRLGALSGQAAQALSEWGKPLIRNHRGDIVGRISVVEDAIPVP